MPAIRLRGRIVSAQRLQNHLRLIGGTLGMAGIVVATIQLDGRPEMRPRNRVPCRRRRRRQGRHIEIVRKTIRVAHVAPLAAGCSGRRRQRGDVVHRAGNQRRCAGGAGVFAHSHRLHAVAAVAGRIVGGINGRRCSDVLGAATQLHSKRYAEWLGGRLHGGGGPFRRRWRYFRAAKDRGGGFRWRWQIRCVRVVAIVRRHRRLGHALLLVLLLLLLLRTERRTRRRHETRRTADRRSGRTTAVLRFGLAPQLDAVLQHHPGGNGRYRLAGRLVASTSNAHRVQ